MKIDLHTHTSQRSGCSSLGEETLIKCAIRAGLDGLAITDHGQLVPQKTLDRLNEKFHPFRIFSGIEISIDRYGHQDLIVVGIHKPALASYWTYDILLKWVRDNGGFIFWVHPFRYGNVFPREIKDNPPDAIEVYSTNIRPRLTGKIKSMAAMLGCPVIGASDAHFQEDLGYSFINLVKSVNTDAELVAELKEGAYRAVMREKLKYA